MYVGLRLAFIVGITRTGCTGNIVIDELIQSEWSTRKISHRIRDIRDADDMQSSYLYIARPPSPSSFCRFVPVTRIIPEIYLWTRYCKKCTVLRSEINKPSTDVDLDEEEEEDASPSPSSTPNPTIPQLSRAETINHKRGRWRFCEPRNKNRIPRPPLLKITNRTRRKLPYLSGGRIQWYKMWYTHRFCIN